MYRLGLFSLYCQCTDKFTYRCQNLHSHILVTFKQKTNSSMREKYLYGINSQLGTFSKFYVVSKYEVIEEACF